MHNFIRVSKNKFQKTPRQIAAQKDGQILFHRIYLATAKGLTSTAAVEWHLKVKDIEQNVGLTKKLLYHSQYAKNQQYSRFIRNLENLKILEKQSVLKINLKTRKSFNLLDFICIVQIISGILMIFYSTNKE